jgi:hypothetical protein
LRVSARVVPIESKADGLEHEAESQPARPRIGVGRACLAAFLLGISNACYSYAPIRTAPVAGSTVTFEITDAGRVGLGTKVGAGAEQIEGVVEGQNDSAYVLRIQNVTYINGQSNQWSNERLEIGKQYVTNAKERRFSKSRTALVAAGAVVGIIAFIASRSLLGLGSDSNKGSGAGGEPQ